MSYENCKYNYYPYSENVQCEHCKTNKDLLNQGKVMCKYCNETFQISGLNIHLHSCCFKQIYIRKCHEKKIQKYEKKIQELEETCAEMTDVMNNASVFIQENVDEIQEYKEEIEYLKKKSLFEHKIFIICIVLLIFLFFFDKLKHRVF